MGKFPPFKYVSCDKDIMISKLFKIDKLIEDILSGANLSDEEDVIPPSLKDAMDNIEKPQSYFFCQNNSEKTFNKLNSTHNALPNTHRRSARQTTVKDFLN
ncbi:hypothetical protein AVEN_164940-1 [Araneus ventricosus]|uniref:Uncharacterized protein n=1 Tax=Araneus ventricosus TaxID=182803 RepID=A0A4Y2MBD2_ARAVE|nr:hypothetical protein AVEN_164940-1 [Araneus ventricosus]